METFRQCPICGEPVTGRRDKVFCSSACKSHAFRNPSDEPADEPTSSAMSWAPVPLQRPVPEAPLDEEPLEEDIATYLARVRREEKAQQRAVEIQQLKKQLQDAFRQLVEQFLEWANQPLNLRMAERFAQELEQAARAYRAHPGLDQGDTLPHGRLKDLYWMGDTVRELVEELNQQSFFGSEQAYQVSRKKYARLREHLLGPA